MSFFKSRLRSFSNAGRGVRILIQTEIHAKIHLIATILVIAASILLDVAYTDLAILIFAIGLVWVAEALNTSIEKMMDLLHPDHHPKAGLVKDVAAGAVLLAAICAAITGILILGPPILEIIENVKI